MLKQLAARLTPPVVGSLTAAVLVTLAAFGVSLDVVQQAAIVAFATAVAVVARSYRTPEAIIGLIAAGIGVATKLGLPVTSAQQESILALAGLILLVAFGKGAASVVKAGVAAKREPPPPLGPWALSINEARAKAGSPPPNPRRKLGRRKPKNAPALTFASIRRAGAVIPPSVDHFTGATFGLYGNDRFGVCGPTSVANLIRLVSKGLAGFQVTPSQADVFDLYKRSGNPNFNPNVEGGVEDNGVDMQTMLEALLKGGLSGIKPVAFAKLRVDSDAELEDAVAIFGGVLWGVNLLTAQQAQTDATPPKWTYRKSGEWGGHAVLNGKFEPEAPGVDAEVISWEEDVQTTDSFREHQLEEAWVVIFPWHLHHPAFLAGIDLQALAAEYKALTGKELPVSEPVPPPTPTPTPAPTPAATPQDVALWLQTREWAQRRHTAKATRPVAEAILAWARASGLLS